MRRISGVGYMLMLVMISSSCIKNYEPEILASDAKKYIVAGQVTEGDSLQKVNVSQTSPIGDPSYIPVTGCHVTIYDDRNHQFALTDNGNGDYSVVIEPVYLMPGVSFKVEIKTPAGDHLGSDFDMLSTVSPMDSIYYHRKDIEQNEPGEFRIGIQFYIDVNGSEATSRYYRWEEFETWEYHAVYPLEWYYDGIVHHVVPPDYSRNVCWSTRRIPSILTLSTNNLDRNRYELFPLHYVSNKTQRLAYGYSLLVKQYAISEAAYSYWEQLRANSNPEGGLYEKQPLAIMGNMHDLDNADNNVLGFFSATSVVSRRIFIKNVPDLILDYNTYCSPSKLIRGVSEIEPSEYPGYLLGDQYGYSATLLNAECINCLLLGGTIIKPSFWPF